MQVHVFLCETPDLFDPTHCTSIDEFKVKPKEIHMLFTDLVQVQLRSISDGNGPPTRFEAVRPCLRRCFNIKLKHPDMELVVGTQVSMSMLLKLDFIEFEEITMTRELWTAILKGNLKRPSTAETSTQTASPSKRWSYITAVN